VSRSEAFDDEVVIQREDPQRLILGGKAGDPIIVPEVFFDGGDVFDMLKIEDVVDALDKPSVQPVVFLLMRRGVPSELGLQVS
jgi:hypothetical protein